MKAGAAKSRPEWRLRRETNEERQMKGDKWRQEQLRASYNGEMKAGAAKSRSEWRSQRETTKGDKWRQEQLPEWRWRRETNERRQMKAGAAKSRPEWRWRRKTNEERQMKAEVAKSRPEWRSCRETNEESQEQARNKWRETNEGRLGGSGRDFED